MVFIDELDWELPDKKHGVFLSDRECRTEQLEIPTEKMGVETFMIFLRGRHHVGLVVQISLAKTKADGEHVLLVAQHPNMPESVDVDVAFIRIHDWVLAHLRCEPAFDQVFSCGKSFRAWRCIGHGPLVAGNRHRHREVLVEPAQAGRGGRPRVLAGPVDGIGRKLDR